MPTERVYAEAIVRKDKTEGSKRAGVPGEVNDRLGARVGDKLVFEEGCDGAVTRAALKGRYFVVRLERAHEPSAQAVQSVGVTDDAPLEPFAEAVRKRGQQ